MHTPDPHLTAPPLRALDQLGITRRVGEAPRGPFREGMRTGAEQLHPAATDDLARGHQRRPQVVHRLRYGIANAGDDLDGVAQQFLVYVWVVLAEFLDHLGRLIAHVARFGVDECELPLDPKGRSGRAGEIYVAASRCR